MKKISLIAVLVAGFSFSGIAQEKGHEGHNHGPAPTPAPAAAPATPQKENPNAPVMTFEFETYDYGTIKQGADGNSEFKFKNTGNEPLAITAATGSCGCTVPTYPKEPIMKGQTGTIKVHYDTKRVGAFTKTVTITSNAKGETKVLTIKGVVEASDETTDQGMPLKKTTGSPLEVK